MQHGHGAADTGFMSKVDIETVAKIGIWTGARLCRWEPCDHCFVRGVCFWCSEVLSLCCSQRTSHEIESVALELFFGFNSTTTSNLFLCNGGNGSHERVVLRSAIGTFWRLWVHILLVPSSISGSGNDFILDRVNQHSTDRPSNLETMAFLTD